MADAVKAPKAPRNNPKAAATELDDLSIEIEEEGGKKKKRRKKERRKRGKAGLIGLIVLVVLVVAAGVFLYLSLVNDWGGVRTSALTLVNQLDPQFRYLQEERIAEYNAAKAQLETEQAQLLLDQQALEQRKVELDRRQNDLTQAESALEPLYRRNLGEEKLNEIKQTGKIYEEMEAQKAADIMARLYDESYMAAILYYMSAGSAADVLSHMSSDLAARVTTELLKN